MRLFRTAKKLSAARVCLVVFCSVWGIACGSNGAHPEPPGEAAAPADVAETTAAPTAAGPGVIEVVMDEYNIFMPERLPAGHTTFLVRNSGFDRHNFEVLRDDRELFRFPVAMLPAAVQTAELELERGVYLIQCTEAGHETRGMVRELVVY